MSENISSPSTETPAVKTPGRFSRAMRSTGRVLKHGSTETSVVLAATVLTIVEPIEKLGEVTADTFKSERIKLKDAGNRFIERRNARAIKLAEERQAKVDADLRAAQAKVAELEAKLANTPAEAPKTSKSLRPAPAN